MRRTKKDVRKLYRCYCRCWELDSLERSKRLQNHGWIENVWIREYDNTVRMSPTERGKSVVREYYNRKNNQQRDILENGIQNFLEDI